MAPKEAKPRVTRNPDQPCITREVSGLSKPKNGGVFPHHSPQSVVEKPPKFYPAEGVKKPLFNKREPKLTKLRLGPFKINGVPLRRVNQAYPIATSIKVDISGVNADKFDDKYFAKQVEKKEKKGEEGFFEAEKDEKNVLPQDKKDDQKTVDAALIKNIEGVPDLKTYVAARFSLKAGMKPHELVF